MYNSVTYTLNYAPNGIEILLEIFGKTTFIRFINIIKALILNITLNKTVHMLLSLLYCICRLSAWIYLYFTAIMYKYNRELHSAQHRPGFLS